ncbi:MAG: pyridoxine 5'-phosphate synthase [Flavobacteriales bacterium]|nr:pyridoxine 5'-phosphate synthase [Flavobacteriales bacterium]
MTKLSVNINKIATLRNARGGNIPDVLLAAERIQAFGADGITVHPRPDERHITYNDARQLRSLVHTEYNIEGNPTDSFVELVLEVRPEQVTLVPDAPDVLTSNAGWDVEANFSFLAERLAEFKARNIRTSLFMECDIRQIELAAKAGADRIELYTEDYASGYLANAENAVAHYVQAAQAAAKCGLGVNAGHDLNLNNLAFFAQKVQPLDEVSIGHALVSDALYLGMENTVQLYKRALNS